MKRFWLTLLLCVFFVASSAQQLIFGSVRDGFLKTPLEKARVTLLTTDSVIVQDSIKVTLNYCCPVNFQTAQESSPKPFRIGLRGFFFKKQAP